MTGGKTPVFLRSEINKKYFKKSQKRGLHPHSIGVYWYQKLRNGTERRNDESQV
jgi:hypothetical protein